MEESIRLTIEHGPHQKQAHDTASVMRDVCIALLPVLIASWVFYRHLALIVIVSTVAGACAGELFVTLVRKRRCTLPDLSATVTGLLLAFSLPPALPWWMAAAGGFFATAIAKQLFGGLGMNIFNPAMAGRAFLMAAYPVALSTWTNPFTCDAISGATPLAALKYSGDPTETLPLVLGNVGGCVGETSVVAIAIGAVWLFVRGTACWRAPLAMLIATVLFSGIMSCIDPAYGSVPFHLFAGGWMLAAVFMVTDPVTTPVSRTGRYIFGAGVALTLLSIRYWGGLPEGTMYSILFMNCFVPIIDRFTRHVPWGRR
jgi:electron transport complex protein RnfD